MTEWQEQANCRDQPRADRMFDDDKFIRKSAAKEFCTTCPVRKECLQDGLNLQERFGVRGGVDQEDLRETQHIDGFGRPSVSKPNSVTCTFCRTEIHLNKLVTQDISCPNCALSWKVMFK